MAMRVGRNTIKFSNRRNIKYLSPFWAKDRNGESVKVYFKKYPGRTATLLADDAYGNTLGNYIMEFHRKTKEIEGKTLAVADYAQEKGIGQILTLGGLMELFANGWNKFTLLSFKHTLGFQAQYGFKINNDNPKFLIDGLKSIAKTKVPVGEEMKNSAKTLIPKLKEVYKTEKDPDGAVPASENLLSSYLKFLMRTFRREKLPSLRTGAYMEFSKEDFKKEAPFLNKLLYHHDIKFKFPETK